MQQRWTDILVESFQEVMRHLALIMPRILAMVTLVLLGWVLATLTRRLVIRILGAVDFDGRCARWGLTSALARRGVRWPPSELLGRLTFWTLLLVACLMGIEALEMPGTAGAVAVVVGFLPNVIVAALVVVAGWILAHFLGQAALITAVNAQVTGAPLVAAAVRWLVLVFAGAVVLTQLGIAREMVLLAFGIAFGGTVLALALAFGLGARDLARQFLETSLRPEGRPDADGVSHV
jgi:Mechanosensitive ion channel, conserved TM helix